LGGESGPICGSFQGGGNGYREVIVGNEAMIEEWSLATADIRARLESDIAQLSQFLERIRVCPEGRDPRSWNLSVSCNWDFGTSATEFGAYEAALAMPSPLYLPAPAEIATLLDTLQGDLFDPDPLIVRPGG
jgi:hypothetical protein